MSFWMLVVAVVVAFVAIEIGGALLALAWWGIVELWERRQ